ncbi:MAG TPA: hypothetical protein PKC85_07225 [Bacteroidia bacterium]|jgi:hypothetical protein|nr:hypothetical protein [Bacteroidia bacterium]HMU19625.1 hypothetical protein [Bacteroidia bacterium]
MKKLIVISGVMLLLFTARKKQKQTRAFSGTFRYLSKSHKQQRSGRENAWFCMAG